MTDEYIDIAEPGDSVRLPLVDILTGRGFVTGKSGSGKSNSVNVVVEEMLDRNQPLLVVDTDGEYWGLKEQYQILHLGNGEQCDVRVTSTDAETIVDLALVERVPIILDISGFLHKEDAQEIVHRVVRELFHREKTLKEPFLLIVEEVHEYIPESGGLSDMGEMLIQVAKRGRKHGLGFVGVSQRPASVDKDFITQCDWITWHRLTWKNDTEVVRTILGSDASSTVEDLDPGEALLMSDWDEQLRNVQVRKKRTFDAGATPGFEDYDPPELIPVNPAILNRFDERRQNVDYGEMGEDEETDGAGDGEDGAGDGGAGDDGAGDGGAGDGAGDARPQDPDGTWADDLTEGRSERGDGAEADASGGGDDAGSDSDQGVVAETVPVEDEADTAKGDTAQKDAAEATEATETDAAGAAEASADAASAGATGAEGEAAGADAAADQSTAMTPADAAGEGDGSGGRADRKPLGEEPVQAEIVASGPEATAPAARNGVNGSPRNRGGPAAGPPAPTDTREGIIVEFAELVLFLARWIRTAVEDAVVWLAGGLGTVIRRLRGLAGTTREQTRLADEDLVVATWLALLVAFILLLAVVLVAVL